MRYAVRGVLTAVVLVAALSAAGAVRAGAAEPPTNPHGIYTQAATFSGPVTVGHVVEPLSANPPGLSAHGYAEQEYFASGTASAFRSTSAPNNGRWTIAPTTSAYYRTRILVRRPTDPAKFNGTVVVEWMNVSAGESAGLGLYESRVDAAGTSTWPCRPRRWASTAARPFGYGCHRGPRGHEPLATGRCSTRRPVRPGHVRPDRQALRAPQIAVLGPPPPKHVVAVGESQSAFYLTTFADAVQPRTHTFDGIFIHSRGGAGRRWVAPPSGRVPGRTANPHGPTVPVFMFETQTDLIALGYASAQQPNTD